MPKRLNAPRLESADSARAVELLIHLSGLLKRQQRHFDEAVVAHCVQLINDYAKGETQTFSVQEPRPPYGGRSR